MSVLSVIRSAPLVLISFLVVVMYACSGKRTPLIAKEIREYDFKFSLLAEVSVYIADVFVPRLTAFTGNLLRTSGWRKTRSQLQNLYGHKRIDTFCRIHTAQKAALIIVVLWLSSFMSLLQGGVEFLLLGVIVASLVNSWVDKQLEYRLELRKRDLLIEMPNFINGLALLVNAGLPFSGAVNKLAIDRAGKSILYQELNRVLLEISTGKSLNRAYEELALRCQVPEMTRFVSVVLQNMNRGTSDLVLVLKMLAQDAWEKRKEVARKQGEEAASKLVFPMVMIFVAVAIIVLAPAVISMGR